MRPADLNLDTAQALLDGAVIVDYSADWLRTTRDLTGVSASWLARAIAKRSGMTCRRQNVNAWESKGSPVVPGPRFFEALLQVLTEELDAMGKDTSKVLVRRSPSTYSPKG